MAEVEKASLPANGDQTARYTWTLGDADTGAPVILGARADGSIQFTGTFASATAVFEGTNDGTNWVTLGDYQGTAVSATAATLAPFATRCWMVRPATSGGSGTTVVATLLVGAG